MVNLRRSKSNFSPAQFVDGLPSAIGNFPRAVDHGVHEAAGRVAEAAEAAQTLAGRKLDQIPSIQIPPRARIRRPARKKKLRSRIASSTAAIQDERRRVRLARRRRLSGNMALGAVVMYHLDPDHGRERRRATSRRVKRLVDGLQRTVSWLRSLTSSGSS